MEYYKNLDLAPINYFCDFDLIWKTEQWVDVVGFENKYQVSDLGRVKSIYEDSKRPGRKRSGRIMSQFKLDTGYLSVLLSDIKRTRKNVHRIVLESFVFNSFNKPCANHLNAIRSDNRLLNLDWATYSENNKYAYEIGNQEYTFGESHNQSKLTEKEVLEIRSKYIKRIYTQPMLAKEYGVTRGAIQCILRRSSWIHI